LSPRKSSEHGLKRRSLWDGPAGIVAFVPHAVSIVTNRPWIKLKPPSDTSSRLALRCRFRRKGINDFLEARIAAERVPIRKQFQLAVAKHARKPGGDRQLLASDVFLTDPGSDDRETLNHMGAVDGIFCH